MTADVEWDTQSESRNPSDAKIPLMHETGTLIGMVRDTLHADGFVFTICTGPHA